MPEIPSLVAALPEPQPVEGGWQVTLNVDSPRLQPLLDAGWGATPNGHKSTTLFPPLDDEATAEIPL